MNTHTDYIIIDVKTLKPFYQLYLRGQYLILVTMTSYSQNMFLGCLSFESAILLAFFGLAIIIINTHVMEQHRRKLRGIAFQKFEVALHVGTSSQNSRLY